MRAVSPVLVGRSAELARLRAAFDAAPGAMLVGGEAGVGKTRLISEFVARVGADARVLEGGCLQLGSDGLPFAPFTAVLRRLVRELGVDGVAELLPRRDATGLARLLPEFGEPESGESTGDEARARLFELVLTLFEGLAEQAPVVLIIEDAHWADRSTRDLLAFLVRNLSGKVRLFIVVTYRIDELHRGHPLRPLLAELDRVERVGRFELSRLSRREVADLVHSITGSEPTPWLVDKVYERSEGNPLFVETLVGCDGELATELPDSLRDLLLAGVQRLPEETQEIVRAASGATTVDHRLLAAVTGLGEAELNRALRPAVAANVLTVDGDGYTFRHALIREAVHEDLLPGEHTRLHERYAEALAEDPGLVPAGRAAVEKAHHWSGAHNLTWALIESWRAAHDTRKAAAYAEELQMLYRVLEYWDRVPDAAERIGRSHARVLEKATVAAELAGELELGIKLATASLKEIEDPVRSACQLERRGRMSIQLRRVEGIADLREAVRRVPADPPTVTRARALATMAESLFKLRGATPEALAAAQEAVAVAREVGDGSAETSARLSLFCIAADYDRPPESLLEFEEIAQVAERSGAFRPLLRIAVNKSHHLEGSGRHELAAEVARAGIERARQYGLGRTSGTFLAINLAEPLMSLGRWEEAVQVIEQALEQDPPPGHVAALQELSGEIAAFRGDFRVAEAAYDVSSAFIARDPNLRAEDHLALVRLAATIALAKGRPEEARDAIAPALDWSDLPDAARYLWPTLVLGAQACLTLTGSAEAFLSALRETAAALTVKGPLQAALHRTFEAIAARVEGGSDLASWDEVADAWAALSQPYARAKALLAAGEVALATGERDAAAARLRTAAELAEKLQAMPLVERIHDLSRRARLTSGHSPGHGLTPRELEVLRLVTEGRSNREIADALFISTKTASVHVSNILAKLHATTRGEAAATAHHLGLFTNA